MIKSAVLICVGIVFIIVSVHILLSESKDNQPQISDCHYVDGNQYCIETIYPMKEMSIYDCAPAVVGLIFILYGSIRIIKKLDWKIAQTREDI
jgi:hypothetical protein